MPHIVQQDLMVINKLSKRFYIKSFFNDTFILELNTHQPIKYLHLSDFEFFSNFNL